MAPKWDQAGAELQLSAVREILLISRNCFIRGKFDTIDGRNEMTKADLIEEVSRAVEMTRKESEVIVEAIFDSIVRSLRGGDKIEIRGFGSFRTRQRQSRIGRNPKTGTRVEVPAKKIPYFKPSKELKDVVNATANGQPSESSHEPSGPPA
jgi:integration host factor subunit beta